MIFNRSSGKGFSLFDVLVALVLFGVAMYGTLRIIQASQEFHRQTSTANQQNVYATFQAQIALQGIDPTKVANPFQAVITSAGNMGSQVALNNGDARTMDLVRGRTAIFEVGASSTPSGAGTNLAGSAEIQAVEYRTDTSAQGGGGTGLGFGVEIQASPVSVTPTSLAPPVFNISGDLTSIPFPLNGIATLPSSNPAGTIYRVTYDGSIPTDTSPIWNNNPAWSVLDFPGVVTLRAFNSDPQYSPSPAVTTTYSFTLGFTFARADGRSTDLYGFTFPELSTPITSGILLLANAPTAQVYFTLDGTNPTPSSTQYSTSFAPGAAAFTPDATLRVVVVSSDPRFINSSVSTFSLTPNPIALPAPSIMTDNTSPLDEGANVTISFSDNHGSPRTALDANPDPSSSSALLITLP